MKKSMALAVFGGSLLLFNGCVTYDPPVPEISKSTAQTAPARFDAVAVFNFRLQDTLKGEGPQLSQAVSSALVHEKIAGEALRIDRFPSGAREAATLASAQAAQAAVFGTIDELIYGGITTESRATVTLELVEASTAKVLWRLTGTLSEPPHKPQDNIFQVDPGKPAPMPMKLARRLVERMVAEMGENPAPPPQPTKDFSYTPPTREQGAWQNR